MVKQVTIPEPHEILVKPLFWVIVGILGIAAVVIFAIPFPYTATEVYSERVPYSVQQSYYTYVDYSGCEYTRDCRCYDRAWYGACNYCQCIEYRTVTDYQYVDRERSVVKYAPAYAQWTGKVKWYYRV